ncbi:tachylectin-related carbohydrate-binding protein [Streptomyces sp. NPDC051940]|uniref:tachylectin-related carbohydrate-binding protein n=1 Tax=Streptomyces sp. NPDC051940 TaxID=3155675 RepID=UPI00342992EA
MPQLMPHTNRTRRLSRTGWSALLAALFTFTAPGAPAQAATSCTTPAVSNYHVDSNGKLRRWSNSAPLTGGNAWSQVVISPTWTAARTISGGNGVIFTITETGDLVWHHDNKYDGSGEADWDPNSGSVIGTGWSSFTTVVGGGDGVIYAVSQDGKLYWYRYLGSTGQFSWANDGRGVQIGAGWNGLRIAASGNGVLYTVPEGGQLRWYRHLDPLGGRPGWANGGLGVTIGSGWGAHTRLASFGAGVLLARNSTGTMFWYRHLDPVGGAANWANGGVGLGLGRGWNDSELVADVTGCRVT